MLIFHEQTWLFALRNIWYIYASSLYSINKVDIIIVQVHNLIHSAILHANAIYKHLEINKADVFINYRLVEHNF